MEFNATSQLANILGRDEIIPGLVKNGLRGIEVYHTEHPTFITMRYEEMANRYGLIITGGSDCHGMGKGNALLGTVKVPYELVEKLKEEAGKIKKAL